VNIYLDVYKEDDGQLYLEVGTDNSPEPPRVPIHPLDQEAFRLVANGEEVALVVWSYTDEGGEEKNPFLEAFSKSFGKPLTRDVVTYWRKHGKEETLRWLCAEVIDVYKFKPLVEALEKMK